METKIISVANLKGGVGKTVTARNVGAGLREKGKKVLLIDNDPQAHLSGYLGFENDGKPTMTDLLFNAIQGNDIDFEQLIRVTEEGDHYIPSNKLLSGMESYINTLPNRDNIYSIIFQKEFFSKYDYVIIDCLTFGGALFTNALVASNYVIIPVDAGVFALDGMTDIEENINSAKRYNPYLQILGILLTRVEMTLVADAVREGIKDNYGTLLFNTEISKATVVDQSIFNKQSLLVTNNKPGEEYRQLVEELFERGV